MALNQAQMDILSRLSKDQLLDFIDLLQKNWWNLQNNYILYLNNTYGEQAAVDADGHVFSASARAQMHRLRKMFGLKDDVQSLMDAMVLSTIWANGEYSVRRIDEKRCAIRVTDCHQQVKRLDEGLGVLPCKPAGLAICEVAAEVINPAFEARCVVCPPDERPDGVWCEWEFELRDDGTP